MFSGIAQLGLSLRVASDRSFAATPRFFAAVLCRSRYVEIIAVMDALSLALGAVHMTGSIFFRVECTAPFAFFVPNVDQAAHLLAPGTERLVNYHVVTDGEAHVQLPGAEDLVAT